LSVLMLDWPRNAGSALHYRSNRHPVLLLRANDLGFRAKDGAVLIHST